MSDLREPTLTVQDILERWPQTLEVFLRRAPLCIGCSVSPFHGVKEACMEHHLDQEAFYKELEDALE